MSKEELHDVLGSLNENNVSSFYDDNEETEEAAYDAFNSETFGDSTESTPNWEDMHALSMRLELRAIAEAQKEKEEFGNDNFDDENNFLPHRMVEAVIEDEEEEPLGAAMPKERLEQPLFFGAVPASNYPVEDGPKKMSKMLTVEELERNMQREAEGQIISGNQNKEEINFKYLLTRHDKIPLQIPPQGEPLGQPSLPREDFSNQGRRMRPAMNNETFYGPPLRDPPYHNRAPNMREGQNGNYLNQLMHTRPGPHQFPPPQHPRYHNQWNNTSTRMRLPPARPPTASGPMQTRPGQYPMHPNFSGQFRYVDRPRFTLEIDFDPYEESPREQDEPYDEYTGLMTDPEKNFIVRIQIANYRAPEHNDYYYKRYLERKQGINQRSLMLTGRNVENLPMNQMAAPYTPAQYDNSLGKLQVGSVNAPRKIIESDIVQKKEFKTAGEYRRNTIILKQIEDIFELVLKVEDKPPHSVDPEHIKNKEILQALITDIINKGDFSAILLINKGADAIFRSIQYLGDPGPVVHQILIHLMNIFKIRRIESSFYSALPVIRNHICSLTCDQLVDLTLDYNCSWLFTDDFFISIVANMLERAISVENFALNKVNFEKWKTFLSNLSLAAEARTTEEDIEVRVVRPVVYVRDSKALRIHLTRMGIPNHMSLVNTLCNTGPPRPVLKTHKNDHKVK